jgi:RNA polymerase sigma-70 factor (ECF subfamily)
MYETESDSELVRLALRSDRGAFAALMHRHSRAVYLYAWGLTRQDSDAEDLTQEVFTTCWRRLVDVRVVDTSALPWLLVTTRNLGRNLLRARREYLELDEQLVRAHEHGEELRWVMAEVARLGGTDQRIVHLCLLQGYGYGDAARHLGLSTSAVAKRVERVRAALRHSVRGEP